MTTNYRAYFNAKDRRLKVSTQNKVPETPAQLHMAVMVAICGLKDAQPNMILRSVFQAGLHLLLTAATRTMRQVYLAGLDGFISMPHQAYCYDFISEWLHSDNIQQLYDVARYVVDEARLHQRFEKLAVEDLVGTECFPCINEVILTKLMTEMPYCGMYEADMPPPATYKHEEYQRLHPVLLRLCLLCKMGSIPLN